MFRLIFKFLTNKVIDLKNIFIMAAALFENSIPMKSRSWAFLQKIPQLQYVVYANLKLQEVTKKKTLKLLTQQICCVKLIQSIKK